MKVIAGWLSGTGLDFVRETNLEADYVAERLTPFDIISIRNDDRA